MVEVQERLWPSNKMVVEVKIEVVVVVEEEVGRGMDFEGIEGMVLVRLDSE